MTPTAVTPQDVKEKLVRLEQTHLLRGWEGLSPCQQHYFLRQVAQIDEELFRLQRTPPEFKLPPATPYTKPAQEGDSASGLKLLQEGRCGCLVLAGGMGSRLRFSGPKGCCPITPAKQKSLFQLLAERVRAASVMAGVPLQLAIMTSPLTHCEVRTYFVQNAFFGLDPKQVAFFYQPMWPLLDFEGNLFLEKPGRIAFGPNGNGASLQSFVDAGVFAAWQELGITHVQTVQIDNPLALPFDPQLLAAGAQSELTLTVTPKLHPQEKVGVVASIGERVHILEYFELPEESKERFTLANVGTYLFSMDFIRRACGAALPLHRAKKAVCRDGILSETPNAWKYEKFIIDFPPLAQTIAVLNRPRKSCFAPLKNFCGEDSIECVQLALKAADTQKLQSILGQNHPPETIDEIAPEFYYPTPEILEKWQGRAWPEQSYVEAK